MALFLTLNRGPVSKLEFALRRSLISPPHSLPTVAVTGLPVRAKKVYTHLDPVKREQQKDFLYKKKSRLNASLISSVLKLSRANVGNASMGWRREARG